MAVVADTWWRAKSALDVLPIVWDNGPNIKVSSDSIAAILNAGLDAPDANMGNENGYARAAIGVKRAQVCGGVLVPFPEPRLHGNHELEGQMDTRALRSLDADPKRRSGAGGLP